MEKSLKPIVINTLSGVAPQSQYAWNKLQNTDTFIKDIITREINPDSIEELNHTVSGIPTPFARTKIFEYALAEQRENMDSLTGMMCFSKSIQNEWKGLLACIALENQYITVDKIQLAYPDRGPIDETDNLFELNGALGNMLFEDRLLWCDQKEIDHQEGAKNAIPLVYVIRYNDVVIGGTSPRCLLFTAPVYEIDCEKGFYSRATAAFTDPLNANLGEGDIEKLFVYVQHVYGKLHEYEQSFKKKPLRMEMISTFLNTWLREIRNYAATRRYRITANAIVPNVTVFGAPFDTVFNYKSTLYGINGAFTTEPPPGSEGLAIEVKLWEILLSPEQATVAEILFDRPEDAAAAGAHMLHATSASGTRYFTLPLSEQGLMIFQNEAGHLLSPDGEFKSKLTADFSEEKNALRVTLSIAINENVTSFVCDYKDPAVISGSKIICWPDFVSPLWKRYYLYSELPHNAPDLKAIPLRGDLAHDFRLMTVTHDKKPVLKKISDAEARSENGEYADLLIEFDPSKLSATSYKYEIYESSQPFKAVELVYRSKSAGYLLLKNLDSGDMVSLKDYRNMRTGHQEVRVGFDFGSNNTCISFSTVNGQPELFTFKNRRRFLLGAEEPTNRNAAAKPNEVFFFQNEETQSNLIKSMIMTHDERRVKGIARDIIVNLGRVVKGGFPVFEKNIAVEDSDETTYKVRFRDRPESIKYNMKWSHIDKENAYKESLLKLLWLNVYAELFEKDRYPSLLLWAYPSSMTTGIISQYKGIWTNVAKLNPLTGTYPDATVALPNFEVNRGFAGSVSFAEDNDGKKTKTYTAMTESEAVCRYALGAGKINAGARGLIIGFDVGGSTTDILCVGQKRLKGTLVSTLIKQSSIKFAAGRLADATGKSSKFKSVLLEFCHRQDIELHGVTIPPEKLNANTSAFYYNMFIDILSDEQQLRSFYESLANRCPELFIINAYMTGLIMFYAGLLALKVKQIVAASPADYPEEFFDTVGIGIFGKGGRMFDWLRADNEGAAQRYYKDCFGLGYGAAVKDEILGFKIQPAPSDTVKAEVSFGLSKNSALNITDGRIRDFIGEEGYTYNDRPIDQLDDIDPPALQQYGTHLSFPREFKNLAKFLRVFYSFTHERFGLNMPNIERYANGADMGIVAYINNIPEFIMANDSEKFDFEAPVIILEGMCFLDEVLLKHLFK